MSESPAIAQPPPLPPVASISRTLRKLFLTLFLRGRTSRGLQKNSAPTSIANKLWMTLPFYVIMGAFAFSFHGQPLFRMAAYLHAMTMMLVGMFVAASSGEVLFNKEEAEILLHRPVTPAQLLWSKVSVLVQVSLWMAVAVNLVGLFAGLAARDSAWWFPFVHALAIAVESLFCASAVVLGYQLCLRWFGRERLDGLMTMMQVLTAVTAVLSGQILPRLMFRADANATNWMDSWWMALLPPAWFAGIDDALAGSGRAGSWLLGGLGLAVTAVVMWMAFGRLAHAYGRELQAMSTMATRRPRRVGRRRWIDILVNRPPLRWWLRNPGSRVSFLLTAAYLVRDRDVKLRVYPQLAPFLIMPFVMLLQGRMGSNNFGLAFCGAYVALVPWLGVDMLRYSQQWQAGDMFRAAPMVGPGPLCHGARLAVMVFLALPLAAAFGALGWWLTGKPGDLVMLLPGMLLMPVFSLVPCLDGTAVPLSLPTEEAKSVGRGAKIMVGMVATMAFSGIAYWANSAGWLGTMLAVEAVISAGVYIALHRVVSRARWSAME